MPNIQPLHHGKYCRQTPKMALKIAAAGEKYLPSRATPNPGFRIPASITVIRQSIPEHGNDVMIRNRPITPATSWIVVATATIEEAAAIYSRFCGTKLAIVAATIATDHARRASFGSAQAWPTNRMRRRRLRQETSSAGIEAPRRSRWGAADRDDAERRPAAARPRDDITIGRSNESAKTKNPVISVD